MKARNDMMWQRWFIFAIVLLALSTAGCSHTVVASPRMPEKMLQEKMGLDVGLYLSEDFKNFQISESRMGDKWEFVNLGQASASQFKSGLLQTFRTVQLVNEIPPYPEVKIPMQAVIEPRIDDFIFDIPMTKFQTYPAKIQYRVIVYDMKGNPILNKVIEGIGDTKGSPGFDFAENPSKSAAKAIEEGVDNALNELTSSQEIRAISKP